MTIAATAPQLLRGASKTGAKFEAKVPLAFSGNYVTGGDTIDLRTMIKATRATSVLSVKILGQAGYDYRFLPGTDLSNGKVMIFDVGAAGAETELAAGAYPAAITGDTVFALVQYLPL